jgi:Cys-tRNA(Pro)/Cys-tRNA(Cys) deacylase
MKDQSNISAFNLQPSSFIKTLAMRVLEGKRVPYEAFPYSGDARDAEEVAALVGAPAEEVYKTLVVLVETSAKPTNARPLLVMIPAGRQLDLKKLARQVKAKRLRMAAHKEAEELTKLQVGGISALALLNRGFVVYLDESARTHEQIYISAGQRGLQIRLAVKDLVKVTNARYVDAAEK